jgi:hypothetical protein
MEEYRMMTLWSPVAIWYAPVFTVLFQSLSFQVYARSSDCEWVIQPTKTVFRFYLEVIFFDVSPGDVVSFTSTDDDGTVCLFFTPTILFFSLSLHNKVISLIEVDGANPLFTGEKIPIDGAALTINFISDGIGTGTGFIFEYILLFKFYFTLILIYIFSNNKFIYFFKLLQLFKPAY